MEIWTDSNYHPGCTYPAVHSRYFGTCIQLLKKRECVIARNIIGYPGPASRNAHTSIMLWGSLGLSHLLELEPFYPTCCDSLNNRELTR